MNVSRARRAVAALVTAAGLAGAGGAAWAEAPISLTPRASMPLTPSVPLDSLDTIPAPRAEPPAPPAGGGVRVDELKPLDPAAAGLLDLQRGGLGDEMWSGSRLPVVQRLMPGLPAAAPSHTMRALMQRLLLSQAAVPGGKGSGPSLIRLRVERLFAMGAVPDMLRLLDALPSTSVPLDLLRFKIEGLLLEGDGPGACAEATRLSRGGDGFAGKLNVYCRLVADRAGEAALGLELLREQGHHDPAFFAVAESVIGLPGASSLDSLPDPSPLQVAMLRLAGRALPADATRSGRPAVLKAIAASTVTPIEVRLAAAEKAESIGALPTEDLRRLYAATTFTGQQAKGSLQDGGVRSRALLFRAAQVQSTPAALAEVTAKALHLAADDGNFAAAARVYQPVLARLRPQADLAWFAGHAARAHYSVGEFERAREWLRFARKQASANADAAQIAAGLWPLARLTEPAEDEPLPAAALAAWRRARPAASPEQAERRNAVLLGLLDALGQRVPTDFWLTALDAPWQIPTIAPRPALWHALHLAAENLRLAETVLVALVALGEDGPALTDPTNLYRVVGSLRLVGFDAEARALAVEAAIANGV